MNIHAVLAEKFEDKEYVMENDGYSGLKWLDSSKKPTENELQVLWDQMETEKNDAQAKEDSYDLSLSNGFDTGFGFNLSISDESYKTISVYADWIDRVYLAKLESQIFPNGILLIDQNNQPHVISKQEFDSILIPYGAACLLAYQKKPVNK